MNDQPITTQEVHIHSIDFRKTKEKQVPFAVIKTNLGSFTCFDSDAMEKCGENLKKTVLVETQDQNGYKHIKKFLGLAPVQSPVGFSTIGKESPPLASKTSFTPPGNSKERLASMCVSYAKDLCMAERIDVDGIELQAVKFMDMIQKMSK